MSTSARRKSADTGTTGRGGSAPGTNTGAERKGSTGGTDRTGGRDRTAKKAKKAAEGAEKAADSEGSATNAAVTEGTSAPRRGPA